MSSKCLPLPRTRCFLLHCKLIGFMAQSWGTALAWSRLARVSNSGNSKSRCPENPCCCLQHILEANLHFCVPRQNTGIGMYGRLTHKVKRKENQRRNCNRKCSHAECGGVKINHNHYSTTRILTVFLHYLRFFLMGTTKLPSTGVSCHWGLRAMDGEIQKTQFQVHALPFCGPCSASFRTLKPSLGLPCDRNSLHWIKRVKKGQHIVTVEDRRLWTGGGWTLLPGARW